MGYNGTKLVYSNGKPQWLMPDGSFVPVRRSCQGYVLTPGSLYIKDKSPDAVRLIAD